MTYLPKTLKVGVLKYRLVVVPGLAEKAADVARSAYVEEHAMHDGVYHEDEDVPLLGFTDADCQTISVRHEMGEDAQTVTVLHEVMHAGFAQAGIRDVIGPGEEESVCKRLAPLMLQVLRDNPRLVEYMTQRRVLGARSGRDDR